MQTVLGILILLSWHEGQGHLVKGCVFRRPLLVTVSESAKR